MHAAVIGGTGHIGSYLVPMLRAAGHDVTVVSRGERNPYHDDPAWGEVAGVPLDRKRAELEGVFGEEVAALAADAVVDLICFTPASCRMLTEALAGRGTRLLHCGTIWVHGNATSPPAAEDDDLAPVCDYGRNKLAIQRYLLEEQADVAACVVHPGHITGPGWWPINPAGNLDPGVFARLARGEPVALPNFGMETLQHVHAADVAALFLQCIERWDTAAGEAFHAVAERPVTLRGYAEAVAAWFDKTPDLRFLPWEQWCEAAGPENAAVTFDHLRHSPHCSMEKARRLLEFTPRYPALEAVWEALERQSL